METVVRDGIAAFTLALVAMLVGIRIASCHLRAGAGYEYVRIGDLLGLGDRVFGVDLGTALPQGVHPHRGRHGRHA